MEDKPLAARKLLENELVQDAFELIRQNLITDFEMCKPSDVDALQLIKLQLHGLKEVQRYIRAVAESTRIEGEPK